MKLERGRGEIGEKGRAGQVMALHIRVVKVMVGQSRGKGRQDGKESYRSVNIITLYGPQ